MLHSPSLWVALLIPIAVSLLLSNKSRADRLLKWPPVAGPWALLVACSTAGSGDAAARLGYEGCKVSHPLSMLEVMGKDMSGGNGANRAHPGLG